MEGQDTTIRLMGTIIELQDELRYYQGGFEKKMIKHLEQMEKKIMERNEEIGNNILKTVCEKMATIKQQVDNIEPAMDKKFDRMMEQLTFQLSQNVHLTANIDPMPYYNIKTWDSDDEWEVDKNGKKTDTLQQLTQGQEQGQGLARTDDQPINEDGNAAPLEHGEKSPRARRVTRALVDYEEPKKLDKDDEQQPSDDVGPKRKKLKNDIGQQTDLENKWRQFAKSFKRKGKFVVFYTLHRLTVDHSIRKDSAQMHQVWQGYTWKYGKPKEAHRRTTFDGALPVSSLLVRGTIQAKFNEPHQVSTPRGSICMSSVSIHRGPSHKPYLSSGHNSSCNSAATRGDQ